MHGVNVDPLNPHGRPDPGMLRQLGFSWVRLVARPGVEPYVALCRAAGLHVLAVLARESGEPEQYRGLRVDALQVGNEMDCDGPSSWRMSPEDYYGLWYWVRHLFPSTPLIVGGLASGNPYRGEQYWCVEGAAGVGVHPYGKAVDPARVLLRQYREMSRLPIYVTEWNRPAEEIGEFVGMLREIGVLGAHWFCYSDGMVRGFGLVDGNGVEGPAWRALTDQLKKEERSMSQHELVAGFKALAEQLGGEAVVGTPVEPETYWPDGVHSSQVTTRGLFVYSKTGNLPVFLPGASPLDLRLPRA